MNMSGIDLSYCNFSKTKIDGVDFSGSNLMGSNFGNCLLCGCDFQSTNLDESDFSHAQIGYTNFDSTSLIGADMRFMKGDYTCEDVADTLALYPNWKTSTGLSQSWWNDRQRSYAFSGKQVARIETVSCYKHSVSPLTGNKSFD